MVPPSDSSTDHVTSREAVKLKLRRMPIALSPGVTTSSPGSLPPPPLPPCDVEVVGPVDVVCASPPVPVEPGLPAASVVLDVAVPPPLPSPSVNSSRPRMPAHAVDESDKAIETKSEHDVRTDEPPERKGT